MTNVVQLSFATIPGPRHRCNTCDGTGTIYRGESFAECTDEDGRQTVTRIGGADICPECLARAETEWQLRRK